MRSGSAHAPEAVAAIDRLFARRGKRDLRVATAIRAGRSEHLSGTSIAGAVAAATAVARAAGRIAAAGSVATVRAAATFRVPRGLAGGAARRAATRLGEATLRVEILFGGSEDELLSAVRTGQVLVAVHETETPLGSRRETIGFLASAVRGVRVLRRATNAATDASAAFQAGW